MKNQFIHNTTVKFIAASLIALLALVFSALGVIPAHALGIVVTVCDEAHLTEALSSGGSVKFLCSGTITLTNTIEINSNTTLDGNGQSVAISGDNVVKVFYVNNGITFNLQNLTVENGYTDIVGGAGIENLGTLTVTNSTFSGNRTSQDGGAIDSKGTLNVSDTTFSGNSANGNGGGISYSGSGSQTLTVTNSTFSGNNAYEGGGIMGYTGTMYVTNSTFSGNSAPYGGSFYLDASTATLKNTLLANNTGGNCYNGGGTLTDGAGNLEDGNSCHFSAATSKHNTDPLLGTLGNYGGDTQTFPLLPDSPAIDAGLSATCSAAVGDPTYGSGNKDQRGVTRPSACDIGAFESQGFTLGSPTGTPQSAAGNTAFASPLGLTVTSAFGEPVAGGRVTFTPPASGASAAITGSPAAILSDGTASVTATSNRTGGSYTVVASAAGANSLDFALTNALTSTTTSLASSSNPSIVGESVTFTATVSPSGDTDTMEFQDGGTDIPGCGNVSVSSGQATCTTSALTVGAHTITALYSGGTVYSSSTGALSPDQQVDCANSLTVSNNADIGAGSLRQAMADICASGTINFENDYTITLATTLMPEESLTIDGSGHSVAISGDNAVRVFSVNTGVTFNLQNLTVENGKGNGGGLLNDGGTVNVTGSTFSGNSAHGGIGGGIYNNNGTMIVTNSTFSGNSAGSGGGIYNHGTLNVTNSTFSGNSGSGIYVANTTTLKNTILANNPGDNCDGDTPTDGGGNLEDGHYCFFSAATSKHNTNPLLGALSNNGGSTQTFPLLPDSPAIDAGLSATCSAAVGDPTYGSGNKDQRGVTRPSACDIGAFESQGFTLGSLTGTPQSADLNTAFANPLGLTVTSAFGEPVTGGKVTFTPPASGASATITGSPATIASDGTVSVTATANSTSGTYNVTARATGATSVNFALTNNLVTPTTTLASSSNPSTIGHSVTFTATISPSAATGTVTFQDGGTNITGCVNVSVSAGKATCATSTLTLGTHTITAEYSGDTNYNSSTGTLSPDQQVNNCTNSLTVSNNSDSGAGSLRQAMADICASGTINFENDYTITLATTLMPEESLTIDGSGHSVAISGDNAVRVFSVNTGVTFNLQNLTVENGKGNGGGLLNDGGTVNVTDSTFSGNSAPGVGVGAGIYNLNGTLIVTNSTFSGNSAGTGGSILNLDQLFVTNSTFSGNSAQSGGGIASYAGGSGNPVKATLTNTLLSSNTGGNCDLDVPLVDGGGNLEDGNSCFFSDATSKKRTNPLLGPLGSYGGATQTFPLLPGSPAIDAGLSATCAATVGSPNYGAGGQDQRGMIRPSACDRGAFESHGFTLGSPTGTPQSTVGNTAFASPLGLTVTSAFGEPVAGGWVTFTPPASGASAAITGSPAVILSDGTASVTATANNTSGRYNVVASTAGANSLDFALRNYQFSTTTSLASSLNPSAFGDSVTFTATISPSAATGTVEFQDGGTDIPSCGSVSVSAGQATCTTSTLAGGTHTITALFNGDMDYNNSTGTLSPDQRIFRIATTTSLASSLNPSALGDPVTFTATLSPSEVTGTVEFQDGGTDIPGCGDVGVSSGQATCTTSTLAVGMHTITALYSGDSSYDSSTGTLSPDQQVLNCAHSLTVTSDSDSAAGSLRQAIAGICTGGTINFDADHTILLLSTLSIGANMTIDGSGHTVIVSGGNAVPVFTVNSTIFTGSLTFNLNNLTVENGKNASGSGGGISQSNGTIHVTNGTFSGNAAYDGAGIYNNGGTLTVTGSSFIGNSALDDGGGIYSLGTLNVTNSTFSGNSALSGGGLWNAAALTLTNSTFSGNSAAHGGGLRNNSTTATLKNTLLANSTSGSNCYIDGTLTDGGGNLEDGISCGFSAASSKSNTVPLLGALGNNGGSTQTFPLLPGSPAIDAALDANCPATDQRGVARPQGPHCDIGSYELVVTKKLAVRDDYDGDGLTDPAKFDSGAGAVWWLKSSTALWDGQWLGSDTFNAVGASDFDGDGKSDPAKFYPSTGTVWWVRSSDGAMGGQWLGSDSFTYVTGSDFDGDGKADPAKFYPATGTLWWVNSTDGTLGGQYLGSGSLQAVSGSDFDGDGKTDPAAFDTSNGTLWWVKSSTHTLDGMWLGSDTFTYVSASDFDGDGKTDPAKFYSDTGMLWWVRSSDGKMDGTWMGSGTFTYVAGCDFNGDGKTDPVEYSASTHTLSWLNTTTSIWTDIDMGAGTYSVVNGQ